MTAWGGQVLWARDAAQARRLIIEIAQKHRVAAVVKSKSMATEEIGLNPALAAAGIQARETDLGEFIVQLAGHPPAHITAPALHLSRHQIAALFKEHLGQESAADPEVLTRQATAYLQPSFYEAQMGITGVNFAAADGTLVLLENENNLRLTAALPPVHVALMGLEKIIPTLAQAEVLLRVLPASATGQRLTALVHFLKGVKPQPGGNQAFYLVILDNGRRRLAAAPELAEALYCLRCGACLNICPIFQVGGAHLYGRVYPGAIGILLAPYLAPEGDIADLCTQCGACQEICPVMIRLAEKIRLLRRSSHRFRWLRALSRAAGLMLAHPNVYRHVARGVRGLAALVPGASAFPGLSAASYFQSRRSPLAAPAGRPEPARPARSPSPELFSRPPQVRAEPLPDDAATLLATRLEEGRGSCRRVRGPEALARLLAGSGNILWLEDHPWLRRVARELKSLGVEPHLGAATWPPQAQAAVTVALGAVPETGSVLVDSTAPAALVTFGAKRQVVLVSPNLAALSLSQALDLTARCRAGMNTWLTGPSRTADIEKVLVLGAQGAQELEVVLYDAEE